MIWTRKGMTAFVDESSIDRRVNIVNSELKAQTGFQTICGASCRQSYEHLLVRPRLVWHYLPTSSIPSVLHLHATDSLCAVAVAQKFEVLTSMSP